MSVRVLVKMSARIAGVLGVIVAGTVVPAVSAQAQTATTAATQAGAARVDTTVAIRSAGTALEFVPARVSVKTGLRVRIRYTNDGTLPHNFVIARSEDDLDAMVAAAYQAGGTGFVPVELREKMLVFSELISPGQTAELTFTVPAPGEYTYICLFPGHANMMIGTLRALR